MADYDQQRERLEEDWGDAIRLAQLWGQYWESDAITRLDVGQAGFLARSFLAAVHRVDMLTEGRERWLRDAFKFAAWMFSVGAAAGFALGTVYGVWFS